MARLSMNEMTTYRWSFEEDVTCYAKADIPAIGVWRQKLADVGEEKGIELLAESGLRVSNLLWAGGFTGSDGRSYRESIEDAEEAIRVASAMQAGCLIVYSGARNGHTHKHCRRLVIDALKELVPLASALEVTLAIEPMHRGCAADWTFLTDLEETLDLLGATESPHLKMVFDTYHLGQERDALDRIPDIVEHVAVVHLGDSKAPPDGEQNRCPLGEGNLPLGEIVEAMVGSGYRGDFDVELIGEEVEASNYTDLLSHSKQAFADMIRPQTGSRT
jgi:sugar phosphate isomerase/epimerase